MWHRSSQLPVGVSATHNRRNWLNWPVLVADYTFAHAGNLPVFSARDEDEDDTCEASPICNPWELSSGAVVCCYDEHGDQLVLSSDDQKGSQDIGCCVQCVSNGTLWLSPCACPLAGLCCKPGDCRSRCTWDLCSLHPRPPVGCGKQSVHYKTKDQKHAHNKNELKQKSLQVEP